jgi:hypothetical protein
VGCFGGHACGKSPYATSGSVRELGRSRSAVNAGPLTRLNPLGWSIRVSNWRSSRGAQPLWLVSRYDHVWTLWPVVMRDADLGLSVDLVPALALEETSGPLDQAGPQAVAGGDRATVTGSVRELREQGARLSCVEVRFASKVSARSGLLVTEASSRASSTMQIIYDRRRAIRSTPPLAPRSTAPGPGQRMAWRSSW